MLEKLLLLNKPSDCSSFDCIRRLKPLLPKRTRIGHAGTLDPFATGLLIVCIGRGATKHLSSFMGLPKTYTATAELGRVTTTLDYTGQDIAVPTTALPTEKQLHEALKSFGDSYEQTPPAYSALKHNGTPLYKLARNGKVNEEEMNAILAKKRRSATIYHASLAAVTDKQFTVTATVSQGTYIRTLMHDIAQRAGSSGATTTELHRAAIGPFTSDQALDLDQLSADTLEQHWQPVTDALVDKKKSPTAY